MAKRKRARGRRVLAPDERRLWERVAATAEPISQDLSSDPPERAETTANNPAETPKGYQAAGVMPIQAGDSPLPHRPRLEGHTVRMQTAAEHDPSPVKRAEAGLDRRTADRLRKGARKPDARIDLHGMRAERAHRACLLFLSDCLNRGHRMVLVITGKGRERPDDGFMATGRGVLRESLPGWLRASPLGHSIIGIYQAHPRHGGEGAFYVYLKRQR